MAGQIDLTFESMDVQRPQVRFGKLRALAVTGPKRSAALVKRILGIRRREA